MGRRPDTTLPAVAPPSRPNPRSSRSRREGSPAATASTTTDCPSAEMGEKTRPCVLRRSSSASAFGDGAEASRRARTPFVPTIRFWWYKSASSMPTSASGPSFPTRSAPRTEASAAWITAPDTPSTCSMPTACVGGPSWAWAGANRPKMTTKVQNAEATTAQGRKDDESTGT
jgi:hypothetical protein